MLTSARRSLCVLGAGGHAKVVIATARAAGFRMLVVHDDETSLIGTEVLGVPVVGTIAEIVERPDVLVAFAIGDNATRHRIASAIKCEITSLVHPTAHVEDSVTLGAGTVVFAGAVIQSDARIGAHAIVNTGATIDHDCVLGDAVHVAPGTHLSGNVSLGTGVLLGIGAVVAPGFRIGAWSRVGAGGVVVHDIPANVTAVGVPARSRG